MIDLVARTALGGRSQTFGAIAVSEGHAGPDEAGSSVSIIELSGNGTLDLLAIGPLARGGDGELVTRLAALRVQIMWNRSPVETVRIVVDRFNADYLWEWLAHKIRIEMV